MHEWALAESIISTVIATAGKKKLKTITEIRINIGELQQIEKDIFAFAIDEIIKSQVNELKNVKIMIKTQKAILQCKNCEHVWNFNEIKKRISEEESESIHFIPEVAFVHTRCPNCSSPDFEIKEGRGISIASIKGKR